MDNKNFQFEISSSPTSNKKITNFDNQNKINYSTKSFQNDKLNDYMTGYNQNYLHYNPYQYKQNINNFSHYHKNKNYDNNINNIKINYYQKDNQEFLHRKKHYENKINHYNNLESKIHIKDDFSKNQETRNIPYRNKTQTFYNYDKFNLNLKEEFNDFSKTSKNHSFFEKSQINEINENSKRAVKIKYDNYKERNPEFPNFKSYSEHKSNSNQVINNVENSNLFNRSVSDNLLEKSRTIFSNTKNSENSNILLAQDLINIENKDIYRDILINANISESKEKIINKNLNSKHLIVVESDDLPKKAKEYCLIQKESENILEIKKSNSNKNFPLIEFTTQEEEHQRINRENKFSNKNKIIKNISNYQKIEEIGEGTYGRVCKYK